MSTRGTRQRSAAGRGLWLCAALAVSLAGCGSTPASYVHPNIDFSYLQRVAVLPFENLTSDRTAGERMHSIFLMEILEAGVLEIVDTRETTASMQAAGLIPGMSVTPKQAVMLGRELNVDAFFFGIVEEYGYSRGDRRAGPEITCSFGMIETETGVEIWRTQVHSTGASVWKRLFGGGSGNIYNVSRDVVLRALDTLL